MTVEFLRYRVYDEADLKCSFTHDEIEEAIDWAKRITEATGHRFRILTDEEETDRQSVEVWTNRIEEAPPF